MKILIILLLLTACTYPEDYSILDDSIQITPFLYVEKQYQNDWKNNIDKIQNACDVIDSKMMNDIQDDGYIILLTNHIQDGENEILGQLNHNEQLILISSLTISYHRVETTLYHEIGHYIDMKNHYSQKDDFQFIFQNHINDNHYLDYYLKNSSEFFAESCAFFLQNDVSEDIFQYFNSQDLKY